MKIAIVPIGNSRGIRIPSALLKQCGLEDQVELRVEDGRIILERPGARTGWEEAFQQLAQTGEDELLMPEHSLTTFDSEEWSW